MSSAPEQTPGPGRRRTAALVFVLVLALALALPLAIQQARAAESPSVRETAGAIIDSLTHAPPAKGEFGKSFPAKPPSGQTTGQTTGQTSGKQPGSQQTGPSAPTQPKAPVVQALPTGSQSANQPLPGSALPPQSGGSSFSGSGPTAPPVWPARPTSAPTSAPSSGPISAPFSARATGQKARPATAAAEPQPREAVLTLEHEGRERRAIVRLPAQRAAKKGQSGPRLPLVVFLHGAGGTASQAMRQTGLGGLAERAGFISVFPEGLAGPAGQESGGLQTWNAWMCCGYARDQRIDDVGYLAALITRLKADYPVDPRRIHLAGFSNGAMLASRFALERPGIVASIASVAGYLPCDAQTPQEPLPVLIIHGNHDQVARFGPTEAHPRTGRFCEDYPAKAQVEFWVRGMNLPGRPQQVQDGRKNRARVERYGKGGRALVEFVLVKGGGHAWPGGPRERYRYCDLPTPDPDATALIWDFFKRQARPGATEKTAPPEKSGKKPARVKGRG